MVRLDLNYAEQSAIQNALVVAAESYTKNAAQLRAMRSDLERDERDNPDAMRFIHSSACEPMAQQFERQAEEARALLEKIDEAEEA